MTKKILTALAALATAVTLVACGGPKTLQSYYEKPLNAAALQTQIDQMKENYSSDFSDVAVAFEDNTMIYSYTFAEAIDEEVKAEFESYMQSNLEKSLESVFPQVKAEAGLDSTEIITIRYDYYNPDGSLVSSFEYSK